MPQSTLSLADVIRQERDRILARFVHEVDSRLAPEKLSRSILVDHVPTFLDEVARELDAGRGGRSGDEGIEASSTARDHGAQRWSLGFDLEALIQEYAVLNHCILGTAKDLGSSPTIDEYDVLAKCLSVGVAEAVGAYTRHRDDEVKAQRERLEFLAEAGQLLASSLDYRSTTRRLTMLVVPRMADWCAIHLDGASDTEMPLAHVDPTKLDLLRRLHVEFPPRDVPEADLDAVRAGEGQLVRQVDPHFYERFARTPQHLEMMRELGTTSWILVPLRVQEHTFGALMLAYSVSGRRYDDGDLALASEVARRAASAIDNAHLYELSQLERARVEAATRAKDEFVAMVSHELRTPLNAILGWLRLMRGGTLNDARQQHALDVIQRNAEAQDRLVADLLDISRIMTGQLRIKLSQLDLSDIVEMAIEAVRPAAETKRIRIETDLDREHAVLRGDGERLQQVVSNLLANAIKFTPKSGAVHVRLRRVQSDVELVVEDNGEGIEPRFLPHVFEVFQQQEQGLSRPHGGLGIGLSIVKHIIDLHGGSITARSAGKDTGATFTVRIPVSPLISSTMGIARVRPAVVTRDRPPLPTGLTDLRVLIVDDDPDARELLTAMLEASGMEVRAAATVPEALTLLATYTPSVLCSDIGLPDDDGYALIRNVRSLDDPKKSSVPAIALTASRRNEDRKRALVEGFNVYLTKPVEPATLVRTVLELSGRST